MWVGMRSHGKAFNFHNSRMQKEECLGITQAKNTNLSDNTMDQDAFIRNIVT